MNPWPRAWLLLSAGILWVALVIASFGWNRFQARQSALAEALSEAHSSYNKDLVYRRWVSMQGGVYVPPTEATPPNPYLAEVPGRDLTTTTGKQLTLVNPAYMTRQVHELGREQYGSRGHITSLTPIRPQNAADEWETKALRSFESGAKEARSVETMDGEPYLRLMHPLITEKSCLKCHAKQGYKEGDIRGGISVSVPLAPYLAAAHKQEISLAAGHCVIGLLGLLGLWLAAVYLRNSNRALQQSEALYRLLFSSVADAVFVHPLDEEGRPGPFLAVNELACERLGYTRSELLKMTPLDIVVADSGPDVQLLMKRLQAKEHVLFEQQHRAKDGRLIPVEVNARSLQVQDRQVVMSVVRDVTERKRMEAEHQHLQTQLAQAQKMESIGQLAGGIAHDFNNILAIIMGYADLSKQSGLSKTAQDDSLDEIMKACERARTLVSQLLAFSRKQTLDMRVRDINGLLRDADRFLRRVIGEDIALRVTPSPAPLCVRADDSQMHQVFMNLAVNARDAMPAGGTLSITAGAIEIPSHDDLAPVELAPGRYVTVAVADTGLGMTDDVLAHVFEPFFTTKEKGKGTGLGLATSYGIVKQHGGDIRVRSAVGRGTEFLLYLPVADGLVPGVEAREPHLPVRGNGETVLLVEDDVTLRALVRLMLDRLGYRAIEAASIEDCLACAEKGIVPDLLLTDVIMPGMNGAEVSARVTAVFPGIKTVYMSGYPDDILAQRFGQSPEMTLLMKPFGEFALSRKLRDVLEG